MKKRQGFPKKNTWRSQPLGKFRDVSGPHHHPFTIIPFPHFPTLGAICLDSDKPQVLSRWKVVTFLEGAVRANFPMGFGGDGWIHRG